MSHEIKINVVIASVLDYDEYSNPVSIKPHAVFTVSSDKHATFVKSAVDSKYRDETLEIDGRTIEIRLWFPNEYAWIEWFIAAIH
jgi:hypothetical protein